MAGEADSRAAVSSTLGTDIAVLLTQLIFCSYCERGMTSVNRGKSQYVKRVTELGVNFLGGGGHPVSPHPRPGAKER